MQRLVIGGVPTLQEAKAAAAELKDAIDSITYNLSSNNSRIIRDKYCHPDCVLLLPKDTSAHSETVTTFSLPKQATQAFSILSRCPVVVSSLVHDPKVWDAMMQNQAVVEFLKSNGVEDLNEKLQYSDYDIENVAYGKCFEKRGDLGECDGENWLRDSLGKIRDRVIEMVRGLSDYFEKLFGSEEVPGEGIIISDKMEPVGGSFFMGLVVMVIMVVLLKRNYY